MAEIEPAYNLLLDQNEAELLLDVLKGVSLITHGDLMPVYNALADALESTR